MARPDPMYEIALVGCGRVAEKHIKAMRHLRHKVSSILLVDPLPAARARILDLMTVSQRKLARGYDSLEELFRERKPDIVAITTPSNSHYALARLAIENRCHLLIEKPMTLDLEEAKDLIQLGRMEDTRIALGHIYRYFPLVNLLQHELSVGQHGRILHGSVHVQWGHDQSYYDLAAWRGRWASDGGVLMNQSVHAVDLMQWLVNAKTVSAQGSILQQVHRMEAEDYGAGLLHFDNKAIIQVEGTTNTPRNRKRAAISLVAEKLWFKASLEGKRVRFSIYDNEGKSLKWYYTKKLLKDITERGVLKSLKGFLNPHTGIYDDLFQSIEYKRAPRASAIDGFNSVAAVLGIYQSASQGGAKVEVPAKGFSLKDMEGYFSSYRNLEKKQKQELGLEQGLDQGLDLEASGSEANKASNPTPTKTPLPPASFQNPTNFTHPGANNEF